jgi:hypothetical protein
MWGFLVETLQQSDVWISLFLWGLESSHLKMGKMMMNHGILGFSGDFMFNKLSWNMR